MNDLAVHMTDDVLPDDAHLRQMTVPPGDRLPVQLAYPELGEKMACLVDTGKFD